jgi:hypothetical protein
MEKQQGSGLIFAVVLLFVILGMVITLSSVTVLETKMNQKSKSSVGAFYNADSGVEWALNKIANSSGYIATAFPEFAANKTPCPAAIGGANTCELYFLDENGKVINTNLTLDKIRAVRAVGTQGGETQRAIEAAVAAGEGYELSCSPSGLSGKVMCCRLKNSDGSVECKESQGGSYVWVKYADTEPW